MAFPGEKRSSENPTDTTTNESEECRPVKRPAMFRASMLKPAPSKFDATSYSESKKPFESSSTPLTGGFMKLDRPDIKPLTVGAPAISAGVSTSSLGKAADGSSSSSSSTTSVTVESTKDGTYKHENPFLQFLSGTHSTAGFSTFSTVSQPGGFTLGSATSTSPFLKPAVSNGEGASTDKEGSVQATELGVGVESDALQGGQGSNLIGNQGATSILPEVEVVTGEEGEKNVLQMSGRLFMLDSTNHTWRERGRGELRLNDTTHRAGDCQSRLVMRASGSYRVLLNTSLWADMKCDRANQKSITMAAQDGDKISVFLIMGVTKDIQQLYCAIDRRLESMRKGASKTSALPLPDSGDDASPRSRGPTPLQGSEEEEEGGGDRDRTYGEGSTPERSPSAERQAADSSGFRDQGSDVSSGKLQSHDQVAVDSDVGRGLRPASPDKPCVQ